MQVFSGAGFTVEENRENQTVKVTPSSMKIPLLPCLCLVLRMSTAQAQHRAGVEEKKGMVDKDTLALQATGNIHPSLTYRESNFRC